MSFGLATTLSTSQKLTPQMQQAIKLLQLSSLELAQEVQAKLDSNPLLERVEDDDEYDNNSDDDIVDELGEPLTLDSWNQDASIESFSTPSEGNTDSSDYDDGFDDSLDKLQQTTIDDSAIDNHTMDADTIIIALIIVRTIVALIAATTRPQLAVPAILITRTLIAIKVVLRPRFKTMCVGRLILSVCQNRIC